MTVYTIFGLIGAIALVLTLLRYFIDKPSNLVICYLQNFVGSLFIFSGFVKAVDPLGTGYKMHEYFDAFAEEGLRPFWEWVANFSTFFSIVMIALELFIGLMLLIGWKPKFTVAIIWFLTLFFTFLTGYTYLSGYGINRPFILQAAAVIFLLGLIALPKSSKTRNRLFFASLLLLSILIGKLSHIMSSHPFNDTGMKVTDCGCFGDFIKLKPWETFYKDVVLDVMILLLVLNEKHIRPVFGSTLKTVTSYSAGVVALIFCLYNVYWNEPVIDFRPYKIGNNIPDLRKEKKPAKIEMVFQCRKKNTNMWESFSYDDVMKGKVQYDKYDSTCRVDKVLDPGIPAKIINLRIENDEGADITDSLYSDPNYSLMVVSYNLGKSNESAFKNLNAIAAGCDKIKVKFYAVTLNDGKVDEFRHRNQTPYPFYNADETPLKTMIRSNPGLILLKNGTVINKWHFRHLPTFEELNSEYFSKK